MESKVRILSYPINRMRREKRAENFINKEHI